MNIMNTFLKIEQFCLIKLSIASDSPFSNLVIENVYEMTKRQTPSPTSENSLVFDIVTVDIFNLPKTITHTNLTCDRHHNKI